MDETFSVMFIISAVDAMRVRCCSVVIYRDNG